MFDWVKKFQIPDRVKNIPFLKGKQHSRKSRRHSGKKYRSVFFISPDISDIQILYKNADDDMKSVIKSLSGSRKLSDVRRTAVIGNHASFVLLTYRGKKRFPSTADCAIPLFYALPLDYSEGGTEIFIAKFQKEVGITVMFDGEMIGYSSFNYSESVASKNFGDMIKENIDTLLNDLNSLGVYIQPDHIIYLHQSTDEAPSKEVVYQLNITKIEPYSIKHIKYTDVLNLKNPYKSRFASDFSISSFASYISYGESNLSPEEKTVYKTIFNSLNLVVIVAVLMLFMNMSNIMLSYRNGLIQKDLSAVETKKKYVLQYQQKYKSMLTLAENYMKIKNMSNNNVLPVVLSILSRKEHVNTYRFNINGNKVDIYVSATDADHVAQYIQDLMDTHLFLNISLPQVYGSGNRNNGTKNYRINGVLLSTFS